MDPNHWNTYNLQYGHSSSGSLPSAHPSLNRLDLTSGLGLSHTLQTTHSSLGRQVSAIPTVSYPALAMPILDPLTTGITASQGHKTMSLTPSQLVFESQVRGTEQQSPTLGRYDNSKSFRADTMARNQLLEVAAARVLSTGNFPSSSLYNQFGPLISDITAPAQTMSSSAGGGSSLTVSKSNQSQMHEPPPAHSSARLSTIQRNPHSSDILYARNTDSLISSNFAPIGPLYGSVSLGKQSLGSSQQPALSRQTPVHIQQGFSSSSDLIEDLSSNSQNQLYGSYAALAVADSQDFAAAHLSGDISYEAVSPAPPMNDAHNNPEHSSFSIVHFPELVNLTPEHAHTLADKFQENDFRLKVDSRAQQHQHEALASPHHSQRLEMGSALKMPKDMSSFHSAMLSMQTSQRSGGQFQSGLAVSQAMSPSLSQIQTATVNINHPAPLIQASPGSLTSMQQALAPLPIQAPADSTTKPKRSRSRKKKENNTSPVTSLASEIKKSSPTQVFNSPTQQQMSTHHAPILNLPPTSHQQHISTLPMSSQVSHSRSVQQQQQQQSYRSAASNQFTSRDAQRAQTPSMPQSYSVQDHQNHGYAQAQSPKVSHQSLIQPEFILPSNMPNEKSSAAQASYKQQKKPGQPVQKSSNSPLFRSNIPDSQPHIQSFSSHTSLLGSSGQQRGSPMQDNRTGGMSRMQSFDHSPQQKMGSQMSPIGQPSPQGSIGADGSGYNVSKVSNSNHMIGSVMIGTPVSVSSQMDSRPVSVEPNTMPHPYEQAHPGSLIDAQDSGQFQIDFSGQPFLEQLVGVPPPMAMPSASFGHSSVENGEVVFTTLVTPAENARLQQQQHESNSTDGFRPTYHGEAVHEIRPIGQIGGHLSMEDVSFNAFFDNQRDMEQAMSMGVHPQSIPEPEKMTLTFMPHVTEDSELCHFTQMPCTVFVIKKEPNEPGAKLPPKGSFQDSFLSYLQGHKQETLSSVSSSAVTKKPQLPKYIPEPRRPRPTASHSKESLNFSDTEDSTGMMSSRVRDLISSLSDNENSSQKSESDREGYSVQRTSELAVKITLPKSKKNKFGPFADMTLLKDSMRRNKEGMLKRKRKKGKHRLSEGEDYMPGQMSDEEEEAAHGDTLSREPTPPPMRMSIGRKAKDKCIEKTKRHDGSDSSSDEIPVIPAKRRASFKGTDSDKDYDSDKDPVWMPIDMDLKPGHDFDEKKKKPRRQRSRAPSLKPGRTMVVQKGSSTIATLSGSFSAPGLGSHRPAQTVSTGDISTVTSATSAGGGSIFKVGTYVIEKKDMHNYETYPVWRLEPENMMKKFEIKLEGGATRHHAVETFSTWMPSMESQFAVVKVREIPGKGEQAAIEVLDECRPKPPSDGRLEQQYENDPLVETFNVYLQVFLSLALEPTFLSAILQTNERFYVDALSQIDGLIEAKCREITGLAHWKSSFQENLHRCPLMKEIDRPNLKQPCQASENSSPPTIKSVLLSGHPYDRCLLTEQPTLGSDVAQEFMIGKVAAQYVRTYHSLYHFKYWLRQRCDAKVKMMKESNKAEILDGEIILDKCLENRSWVLQLFDNLKSLLKYGGETAR